MLALVHLWKKFGSGSGPAQWTAVEPTVAEPASEQSETPSCQWSGSLEQLIGDLHLAIETVESEFLSVGSRLHDFHRCGSEVVRMSSNVVDQVAGERMTGAIRNLEEIFNHMCSYISLTEQQTGESIQTLRGIDLLLADAEEPLAGFRKMNKVLRMFGASTKIENARVEGGGAGFETIADEVVLLAERVQQNSRSICSQKKDLSSVIRQAVTLVGRAEAEQSIQVRTILENTRQSLASLVEINSQCSRAAVELSTFSEEVARNIGEIVVSMQFHDIVRQKVEHVTEALQGLNGRLAEFSQEELPRELIMETVNLCELLEAHLVHARDELLSAVGSVAGNLGEVARKEMRLAEETRRVAGIADRSGVTFFEDMERGLGDVRQALAKTEASNRDLADAMATVAGTVENIASFVTDIEEICEEIELISINAQIKSARIGKGGAALGVIAESIQRLSLETTLRTTPVSTILLTINESAAGQSRQVCGELSRMESDVEEMGGGLGTLLSSICRINESLMSSLSHLETEVALLSADIEGVVAGISSHKIISEVLGSSIGILGKIAAEARGILPDGCMPASVESLSELAERYTMESERSVHASLFGDDMASATSGSGNDPPDKGGDGEEFGDNVELF